MKILIIGGTGNISTPITQALIERGDEVVLYNRGSAPVQGARQITGDRTDYARFEEQLAQEGWFDCVIDMVAYAPEDARSVVRAFHGRIGQYIFCSTVDVYTRPAPGYPIHEGFERRPNPDFEYASHKATLRRYSAGSFRAGRLPGDLAAPRGHLQRYLGTHQPDRLGDCPFETDARR